MTSKELIDKILGTPNQNPLTGIRYGIVSLESLQDWVFDEFFYQGVDLSWESAKKSFFESQGSDDEDTPEYYEFSEEYECSEPEYELEVDGMKLGLSYLGGCPIVWVFESPHTCHCADCSPCIPGSGDLDTRREPGSTTYDLPQDWYLEREKERGKQS